MIYLEFWNTKDFGGVLYDTQVGPFKSSVRLPVVFQAPKYKIVEQGEKVNGQFRMSSSVSYKIHTGIVSVPEYLVDALQRATHCDHVYVNNVQVNGFAVKIEKNTNGYYQLSLEFITDLVIKSVMSEFKITRKYLEIGDGHTLLIGGGYKLRIQ